MMNTLTAYFQREDKRTRTYLLTTRSKITRSSTRSRKTLHTRRVLSGLAQETTQILVFYVDSHRFGANRAVHLLVTVIGPVLWHAYMRSSAA